MKMKEKGTYDEKLQVLQNLPEIEIKFYLYFDLVTIHFYN